MATPITIIFPAYVSQEDVDNGFVNLPDYVAVRDTLPDAVQDAGLSADTVKLQRYPMGYEDVETRLKLRPEDGGYDKLYLPQLLFATPDPNKSGAVVVLAKLVKGQINRKNIALMLKVCDRLKKKTDAAGGRQSFYDPTLHSPISIGFNPADAPGGWLIGLNATTYNVELSRYGQQVEDFFKSLGNILPYVLGGLLLLAVTNSKQRPPQ